MPHCSDFIEMENMLRLHVKLIIFIVLQSCIGCKVEAYGTNSSGISLMMDRHYQQDPRSIQCVGYIADKYLRWEQTFANSIFIINFTRKITVLTNLLIKGLVSYSNYKISYAVKLAHTLYGRPLDRGSSYLTSSYFAFVNETWEVELTIR